MNIKSYSIERCGVQKKTTYYVDKSTTQKTLKFPSPRPNPTPALPNLSLPWLEFSHPGQLCVGCIQDGCPGKLQQFKTNPDILSFTHMTQHNE